MCVSVWCGCDCVCVGVCEREGVVVISWVRRGWGSLDGWCMFVWWCGGLIMWVGMELHVCGGGIFD